MDICSALSASVSCRGRSWRVFLCLSDLNMSLFVRSLSRVNQQPLATRVIDRFLSDLCQLCVLTNCSCLVVFLSVRLFCAFYSCYSPHPPSTANLAVLHPTRFCPPRCGPRVRFCPTICLSVCLVISDMLYFDRVCLSVCLSLICCILRKSACLSVYLRYVVS